MPCGVGLGFGLSANWEFISTLMILITLEWCCKFCPFHAPNFLCSLVCVPAHPLTLNAQGGRTKQPTDNRAAIWMARWFMSRKSWIEIYMITLSTIIKSFFSAGWSVVCWWNEQVDEEKKTKRTKKSDRTITIMPLPIGSRLHFPFTGSGKALSLREKASTADDRGQTIRR